MKTRLVILVLCCGVLGAAMSPPRSSAAGRTNGVAGSTPAYYDHDLFTINLMELEQSEKTLLAHNSQANHIYMSTPGLPGGALFISVIDAVHADGFNPLWSEVQIRFTADHTPRQLFSDDEIAAAAASGEVTLTTTGDMFRCSIIGKPMNSTVTASRIGVVTASAIAGARVPARADATPLSHATSWGAIKIAFE